MFNIDDNECTSDRNQIRVFPRMSNIELHGGKRYLSTKNIDSASGYCFPSYLLNKTEFKRDISVFAMLYPIVVKNAKTSISCLL